MLTCFNLRDGTSIEEFSSSYISFVRHLEELGLVKDTSPIGCRRPNSGLDTDVTRSHQYYAVMNFEDAEQAERARLHIKPRAHPTEEFHFEVLSKARDLIFVTWEDI